MSSSFESLDLDSPVSLSEAYQALPTLEVDGYLDVAASNRAQQRGPHGAFRFFGKLAPDVTGAVLDLVATHIQTVRTPLVDLMCGSGTTLIEAADRGWSSVGIDCNPVAQLYAECKTQAIDPEAFEEHLKTVERDLRTPSEAQVTRVFGGMRNGQRWFSPTAQRAFTSLSAAIGRVPTGREQRLLRAVLVSRARRFSRASERTGRIFYDASSEAPSPVDDFVANARRVASVTPLSDLPADIRLGDARQAPIADASSQIIFCHPPYFGLYRFSSDVLRFELELGGFDRRAISRVEVREGWKSGDIENLEGHVEDMHAVFREGRRIATTDGLLVVVTSNSTLGDVQLPVVDRLAAAAVGANWNLERHVLRRARFGSASYHRSARLDKVIQQDHVLLFRAA